MSPKSPGSSLNKARFKPQALKSEVQDLHTTLSKEIAAGIHAAGIDPNELETERNVLQLRKEHIERLVNDYRGAPPSKKKELAAQIKDFHTEFTKDIAALVRQKIKEATPVPSAAPSAVAAPQQPPAPATAPSAPTAMPPAPAAAPATVAVPQQPPAPTVVASTQATAPPAAPSATTAPQQPPAPATAPSAPVSAPPVAPVAPSMPQASANSPASVDDVDSGPPVITDPHAEAVQRLRTELQDLEGEARRPGARGEVIEKEILKRERKLRDLEKQGAAGQTSVAVTPGQPSGGHSAEPFADAIQHLRTELQDLERAAALPGASSDLEKQILKKEEELRALERQEKVEEDEPDVSRFKYQPDTHKEKAESLRSTIVRGLNERLLFNRGQVLKERMKQLGVGVWKDLRTAVRGTKYAVQHPLKTFSKINYGAQYGVGYSIGYMRYLANLTKKKSTLEERGNRLKTDLKRLTEGYNRLPMRHKLYITAALVGTSAVTAAASLPTVSSVLASGVYGQRTFAGVGFGLNRRKAMDTEKHWLRHESKEVKDRYALTLGLAYGVGTSVAGGYAVEKLSEWLGSIFGHHIPAPSHSEPASSHAEPTTVESSYAYSGHWNFGKQGPMPDNMFNKLLDEFKDNPVAEQSLVESQREALIRAANPAFFHQAQEAMSGHVMASGPTITPMPPHSPVAPVHAAGPAHEAPSPQVAAGHAGTPPQSPTPSASAPGSPASAPPASPTPPSGLAAPVTHAANAAQSAHESAAAAAAKPTFPSFDTAVSNGHGTESMMSHLWDSMRSAHLDPKDYANLKGTDFYKLLTATPKNIDSVVHELAQQHHFYDPVHHTNILVEPHDTLSFDTHGNLLLHTDHGTFSQTPPDAPMTAPYPPSVPAPHVPAAHHAGTPPAQGKLSAESMPAAKPIPEINLTQAPAPVADAHFSPVTHPASPENVVTTGDGGVLTSSDGSPVTVVQPSEPWATGQASAGASTPPMHHEVPASPAHEAGANAFVNPHHLTINPNTPHGYTGPGDRVYAFGGKDQILNESALAHVTEGQSVYVDESRTFFGIKFPRVVEYVFSKSGQSPIMVIHHDASLVPNPDTFTKELW